MLHVFFLGFSLFVGCGYALYKDNPYVVELTPFNFNNLVTGSDGVWLVEYYAPWCSYCQRLAPDYVVAAKALKGLVKVGAVNGDKFRGFAVEAGVKSYPTIKIFTGNANFIYKGRRVVEGLVEACFSACRHEVYKRLGKNPNNTSIKVAALESLDKLIKNYMPRSKVLNENECKI